MNIVKTKRMQNVKLIFFLKHSNNYLVTVSDDETTVIKTEDALVAQLLPISSSMSGCNIFDRVY